MGAFLKYRGRRRGCPDPGRWPANRIQPLALRTQPEACSKARPDGSFRAACGLWGTIWSPHLPAPCTTSAPRGVWYTEFRPAELVSKHTHTHTHNENRKNKNTARKAVEENSSGAAGQPWTSFGLLMNRMACSTESAAVLPLLPDTHTHTHDCKTNEHNAAQNVRFLVSWIVKQEACSTPIGAFLRYRTQACNILEP